MADPATGTSTLTIPGSSSAGSARTNLGLVQAVALTLRWSPAPQNMAEMGIYPSGSKIKTSAPVLSFFIPNGPG
jgi:hypothetical protein